jgi:hypothetical protein
LNENGAMELLKRVLRGGDAARRAPDADHGKRYFSAQIRCDTDACEAARNLRSQRFLAREAPSLPLDECDRKYRCKCWYRYGRDRRVDQRRCDDRGVPVPSASRPIRERQGKGRRADDR